MNGVTRDRYGPPETLELRDIDEPVVGEHEVLVRFEAASVSSRD